MKVPSIIKYWIPTQPGRLKMNVDDAFEAENKSGGWGFVLRDHEGTGLFVGAGNKSVADLHLSCTAP